MAMPVAVPRYTVDDLESFPDDGNRYELLDGILLVTPAPLPSHEIVLNRIRNRLIIYLGDRAEVFTHAAVQVRPRTHLEPDILVVPSPIRITGRSRWSDVREWWLQSTYPVAGPGSTIVMPSSRPTPDSASGRPGGPTWATAASSHPAGANRDHAIHGPAQVASTQDAGSARD